MSEDDAVTKLAVREAVCAEGWKQASDQFTQSSTRSVMADARTRSLWRASPWRA